MISVLKINDVWFSKTIDFLKSVPSIESIEESILKNACIAVKEDKIVGCISYEEFTCKGLIRYFVFKKALDLDYLEKLLDELKENALKNNIKEFVCVAESDQIKELFKSLTNKELTLDSKITSNKYYKYGAYLEEESLRLTDNIKEISKVTL